MSIQEIGILIGGLGCLLGGIGLIWFASMWAKKK